MFALFISLIHTTTTAIALPHDQSATLFLRADTSNTTSTSTSPSSDSTSTASPIPSPHSSSSGGTPPGTIAGIAISGAAVVVLFLAIFIIVMRHQHKERRNHRHGRIYINAAVTNELMRNYERDARSNHIKRNGSGGMSLGSMSSVMGGSLAGLEKPQRAARPKMGSVTDSPPPSYWEAAGPPHAP